mmetsp:Transcript_18818/g.55776  ORF Transcript_18818/g.55776 Transcript_18818/m.55776 type:complete len:230 (-) Transcript_18818:117-806(-)
MEAYPRILNDRKKVSGVTMRRHPPSRNHGDTPPWPSSVKMSPSVLTTNVSLKAPTPSEARMDSTYMSRPPLAPKAWLAMSTYDMYCSSVSSATKCFACSSSDIVYIERIVKKAMTQAPPRSPIRAKTYGSAKTAAPAIDLAKFAAVPAVGANPTRYGWVRSSSIACHSAFVRLGTEYDLSLRVPLNLGNFGNGRRSASATDELNTERHSDDVLRRLTGVCVVANLGAAP